ncbi:Uncharacterised protein [Aedoeadaptatus ivorii]|uniref:Uncharacterized protein n=1 Tax=Aedoeadaptatus ivorii TaxID=54006 RepID=A0A448V0Y0_9FIRM|nr:hypothetical protein [Peptoniphilus ivorii]MDQ0509033.1 membrane protein YdbS with pleckstrin-like domain [Peptoniphilus ivorii]VEJ35113.1 Uncharacterised protein [Peptoniphilus ivorii]
MEIEKTKLLQILKKLDYIGMFALGIMAVAHPFLPLYDASGNFVESAALARIAVIMVVLAVGIPFFKKEINAIDAGKKPFNIHKKHPTVVLPKVNKIIAIAFAVCPFLFIPLAIWRYKDEGLQWQFFYSLFYVFVYLAIGTRLQLKIALQAPDK